MALAFRSPRSFCSLGSAMAHQPQHLEPQGGNKLALAPVVAVFTTSLSMHSPTLSRFLQSLDLSKTSISIAPFSSCEESHPGYGVSLGSTVDDFCRFGLWGRFRAR